MEGLLNDEFFMREALRQAREAEAEDEIPIGAVIVTEAGRIIAKGHNQTERLNDVTAHAEMLAYTAASGWLGAKYLKGCTLYVTVEPCPMCAAALHWAQIDRIVFGAFDAKRGYSIFKPSLLHPKTQIEGGLLHEECAGLMKSFFARKRNS